MIAVIVMMIIMVCKNTNWYSKGDCNVFTKSYKNMLKLQSRDWDYNSLNIIIPVFIKLAKRM